MSVKESIDKLASLIQQESNFNGFSRFKTHLEALIAESNENDAMFNKNGNSSVSVERSGAAYARGVRVRNILKYFKDQNPRINEVITQNGILNLKPIIDWIIKTYDIFAINRILIDKPEINKSAEDNYKLFTKNLLALTDARDSTMNHKPIDVDYLLYVLRYFEGIGISSTLTLQHYYTNGIVPVAYNRTHCVNDMYDLTNRITKKFGLVINGQKMTTASITPVLDVPIQTPTEQQRDIPAGPFKLSVLDGLPAEFITSLYKLIDLRDTDFTLHEMCSLMSYFVRFDSKMFSEEKILSLYVSHNQPFDKKDYSDLRIGTDKMIEYIFDTYHLKLVGGVLNSTENEVVAQTEEDIKKLRDEIARLEQQIASKASSAQ
jgi:hypothetical protein